MAKRIGVLLAGCGVFDGTEIHEAVLTLLALERAGAHIVCTAPDMEQRHVVNHLTREAMEQKRNVLVESARIARGAIVDIQTLRADDLDALIIPGGFGAVQNLSDFAEKGPEATVHPEVQRLLIALHAAAKPIGAICIAPATLTKALSAQTPTVTIGTDHGTAMAIETMGGRHQARQVDEICFDAPNRLVSTPAYMLGPGIKDVAVGIEKLVAKVLELA